ncbi:dendrin-like [Alligator mississippiensis]|uniref:dendrin-like n=1 Tax=Alligator mississippiensis TaxID=8496 RepID=UPI0028781509|nr:dendrin-like [Alligator mississippiensis]
MRDEREKNPARAAHRGARGGAGRGAGRDPRVCPGGACLAGQAALWAGLCALPPPLAPRLRRVAASAPPPRGARPSPASGPGGAGWGAPRPGLLLVPPSLEPACQRGAAARKNWGLGPKGPQELSCLQGSLQGLRRVCGACSGPLQTAEAPRATDSPSRSLSKVKVMEKTAVLSESSCPSNTSPSSMLRSFDT